MAHLRPATLTCPSCGAEAPIKWVIGAGPRSGGVAYISALGTEDWDLVRVPRGVRVMCKACGAEVAQRAGKTTENGAGETLDQ